MANNKDLKERIGSQAEHLIAVHAQQVAQIELRRLTAHNTKMLIIN